MHFTPKSRIRSGISVLAVALAAVAAPALAQNDTPAAKADAATPAAPEAEAEGDVIVVTGTPGGSGVRKMDASYAITTINTAALERVAPKSTAEVFSLVPGVWAESSGGVSGANIDVRGLPGGGDAPWVTMSINGAPIYGTESLSFMEQSSIFRTDETIASTEAAHGGPNAVFSNGEVGVTLNFNLKKGRDTTEGRVKLTATDYSLFRADAVLSGPLGDDFYYMIGGYVSQSRGIRNAQFQSEKGRQVSAQLTKRLANGEFNVWTRLTDDHGQWYLPMALNTGNDLGTFSQLGNATRYESLRINANGDTENFDFAKGRGWKGSVSGVNFKYDMGGGWSVRDNLSYTHGNADTYGFVPDGAPIKVSALQAAFPSLTSVKTAGGTTLAGTNWVQNYGHWVVQKGIDSLTNDLSLSYKAGVNEFTVGYYRAGWSADDFWSLGNFRPVQNVANGDYLQNGVTCTMLKTAGSGSGCWAYGIQASGDARVNALYLADSINASDAIRIDLGIRQQWLNVDYVLDSGPGYPDGVRDKNMAVSASKFSYTAAINYKFDRDLSMFLRYSKGFRFPNFDDLRDGNQNVFGVAQLEGGVKYAGSHGSIFVTAFYNKNDNFESTVGSTIAASSFKTRAIGVEVDGDLRLGNFDLAALMTLQNAKVTQSSTASQIDKDVHRQPNFQLRLSPSYVAEIGSTKVTFFAAASFVGDRWSDLANSVKLAGYTKVDAGISAKLDSGLNLSLRADNLTNSHGLTEGDPRNPTAPNGRPILGRSLSFSVGYDF